MDWRELLQEAETEEEVKEIIKTAMMIGVSKEEIEAELDKREIKH